MLSRGRFCGGKLSVESFPPPPLQRLLARFAPVASDCRKTEDSGEGMALYNVGSGKWQDRAQNQANGAMKAMGSMTRENQTTEITPGSPPATQILQQGVGLTGTANQLWNLKDRVKDGYSWLEQKFKTPDAQGQAQAANAGGQAVQDFAEPVASGVQMNSGPQVAAPQNMPDFINQAQTAQPLAGMTTFNLPDAQLAEMGSQAAQNVRQQMYAMPEYLGGSPELAQQASQTASQINVAGPENVTGGLTATGVAGSSIGGLAGGFAGKELGRAIGGDTGATIGGIAGSVGGSYLGGLAAGALAGEAVGTAGGVIAGAAAGSAVPGLGTVIGAGIGALGSFFF